MEFRQNGEFLVKSNYLGLIHQNVPNFNKRLWKLKTSMKIKIFLWYIWRGVILTKDNLAKWNWHGNKQCCFCHENEMIHLFLDCQFAHLVWATGYAAQGLPRPHNVSIMFGRQLGGLRKDLKLLVLMGATSLCWSLWLYRNAVIFENKQSSFLQIIYSTTHWLYTWSILQKPTSQALVVVASQFLGRWPRIFFP